MNELRWRRDGTTYEVPVAKRRDGVVREPYKAHTNPKWPVRHVGDRQRARWAGIRLLRTGGAR